MSMSRRVLFSLLVSCLVCECLAQMPMPARTFGGAAADNAVAVALDSAGNVYLTGWTASFGAGGLDALITKYSPTGQFLWAKTWGGASDEYAWSTKVGPDGYLYVAGATLSFGAGWSDLFLLKLDISGNLIWGTTWGGGSYDGGYDLDFDQNGNIYVAGESYSSSPCCAAVVLKFSSAGALLQTLSYKGPALYDSAYSIAVDSNQNVIVAGISWDYSTYSSLHNSILLLKYDPNGNLLWQENWSSPYPAQDESWSYRGVTTDSSGNIYLAGRHANSCPTDNFSTCDFDALLVKVDPNGGFLWAKTSGSTGTYDTSGSVVVDPDGEILLAAIKDEFGTPHMLVERYGSSGNVLSQVGWNSGTVQGFWAGMTVAPSGDVYVVSSALNNSGSWATTSSIFARPSNSFVVNSFGTVNASESLTPLTNATELQTGGVKNSGGGLGDFFLAHHGGK